MKTITIVFITALIFLSPLGAEENKNRPDRFNIGFGLTDSQGNFGLQGEINSPRFVKGIFALKLRGGMEFASSDIFAGGDDHWDKFYSARAGLIAGSGIVSDALRLYGEFGALTVFAEDLTGEAVTPGIYGLFGFEFFTSPSLEDSPVSYYIEMGSSGINLKADKLDGANFYNGFKLATGVRWYL